MTLPQAVFRVRRYYCRHPSEAVLPTPGSQFGRRAVSAYQSAWWRHVDAWGAWFCGLMPGKIDLANATRAADLCAVWYIAVTRIHECAVIQH
jgi:hypothetical protein